MKTYTEEQVKKFLKERTFLREDTIDAMLDNIPQSEHNVDINEMISEVTRFEVIDHTSKQGGRIVVEYGVKVELSLQDDNRTLKVFLTNQNKD